MSSMMRKLALVSHLKLLNGATSGDPKPIAGYMYDEICKITFTSVSTCAELQDDLLSRLKKKSVHTKYKVLKILKHLVEKGHEGFKQDLQRRTELIRDAMSYRGPQDQMHGDTYNKLVRDCAAELMESLFDASTNGPRSAPGQGPSVLKSSASGMGSSSNGSMGSSSHGSRSVHVGEVSSSELHLGTGDGPLARSGKLVGFGNQSNAPEEPKSMMDRVKQKAIQLKDKAVDKAKDVGGKLKDAYNERRGIASDVPESEYGNSEGYEASYQSGSYHNSNISASLASTSTSSNTGGYEPPTLSSSSSSFQSKKELHTDSGYEARLVDDITMPVGVRAAPPKSSLTAFVSKCESLDCTKIANLLEDKLSDAEPDKTKIRALYVIEAMLQSSIPGVHTCFADCRTAVEAMQSASHSTVREMSIRVLGVMDSAGSASPTKAAAPVAAHAPASSTATGSLLDFGEPAAAAPAASASSAGGLFDGMSVGEAPSEPSSGGGGGLFAGMEVAADSSAAISDPASISTPPEGGGMFSGMQVNSESGPTISDPAPAVVPAAMDATTSLLDGLDLTTPAPAAAPVAEATESSSGNGDLLGDLFGSSAPSPVQNLPQTQSTTTSMGSPYGLQSMGQPMMMGQSQMGMGAMQQPGQGIGLGTMQQPGQQGMGMNMSMGMSMSPQGMQPQMMSNGGMMGSPQMGMGMGGVNMMGSPGFNLGGTGGMGSMGNGSSASSNASSGNNFSFVKKPPAKGGSDPFGFISETVSSEAHKK